MSQSVLDAHFRRVSEEDRFFRFFWAGISDDRRSEYRRVWEGIESVTYANDLDLLQAHFVAFDRTKRYFVRVQEREFLYGRIPTDWAVFARNKIAKHLLFEEGLIRLRALIDICGMSDSAIIYGNIKEDESLDRKLNQERLGSTIQTNVTDLWDLVRFRVVVADLNSLVRLAVRFWEKYFDQVLRCRNYYYRPRNLHTNDPYRAIHFELANERDQMIEVQLMTKRREAVCLLDHAALFKRALKSFSETERQWLHSFSTKANILDADECDYGWAE